MKSESVWKVLTILVVLLVVAIVAGAVNMLSNSADDEVDKALGSDDTSSANTPFIPVYKYSKMSPEVIMSIPPPIGGPLTPMIVKIYLIDEDPAYVAELKPYVIEILNVKGDIVRAEIYTNRITDIAGLEFVSYVDVPLYPYLDPVSANEDSFTPVYKHPKMSPEVIRNIPPPIGGLQTPMIVKIYLIEEDPAYVEELKHCVIEILNVKGDVVRAKIYTNRILDISGLEFVSYVDTPLYPHIEVNATEDSFTPVYKHPKMSPEMIRNIPPPIGGPLTPMIVKIYMIEEDPANIEELAPYVIEILNVDGDVARAKIYTNRITDIAGLDFVSYVDTPLHPYLDEIVSEGVECMHADELHEINVTGKDVKVAVLDLGFEGYEELQESGELPKNMTTRCFRTDGGITGGGEIHGSACAEVIHDVAPDAELFLVNYFDVFEFDDAVDWLIEQNVDVISHSAGMLVGLFDGTDSWDKKIDEAVENGVVWVNSAGNHAEKHWEGWFYDPEGNGYHNFNGDDENLSFFVEKGYYLQICLSWDDAWRNATQDYDMEVFDPTLQYRMVSDRYQIGNRGDIPIEMIGFYAPSTGHYLLKVHRTNATRDVHFEIYTAYNSPEYIIQNSSLCGCGTANKSLTVGAFNCTSSWEVKSYSSRGPTNDGRAKPDVVAPTDVSNYAYLSLPERSRLFGGTSAAAPHVAGAAALLLSKNSSITPDGIKKLLNGNAMPISPPTPSNVTGYGLINLTFATV